MKNSLSKIIVQSNTLTGNQNDIIKSLSNMVVNIKSLDNKFENKLITLQGEQIDFLERMKKHSEKLIANQNLNNSNIISSVKFFDGSINKLRDELSLLKSIINEDQKQLLNIVKDITSKGFVRNNYKKKLVDLSDIRINLKGKK